MTNRSFIHRSYMIALLLMMGMVGCARTPSAVPSLELSELFSIPIGLSQDRLYYSTQQGSSTQHTIGVDMYNGMLMIASNTTNKVSLFNSYGDMIGVLYNPNTNPQSIYTVLKQQYIDEYNQKRSSYTFGAEVEQTESEDSIMPVSDGSLVLHEDRATQPAIADENIASTRLSIEYLFNDIGPVAFNGLDEIYITDHISLRQQQYDERLDTLRKQVVLKFTDGDAEPLVIGEEGIDGRPFPHIVSIETLDNGDLVVVADADEHWLVYWYDSAGTRKYFFDIGLGAIPAIETPYQGVDIINVAPDYTQEKIYIGIKYYVEVSSDDTRNNIVATNVITRVYWIDIANQAYQDFVELPSVFPVKGVGDAGQTVARPLDFTFLNTSVDEYLYFYSQSSNAYATILVLDTSGTVILRQDIEQEDVVRYLISYHTTADGIITSIELLEDRIKVGWWRIDNYLATL